ncbi:MAG: DUF4105 domain-containing protein [Bradymonadaceae bacterium]|nr:DUF4105 domain-containing protein [Lujinxingiaceae bacterium]
MANTVKRNLQTASAPRPAPLATVLALLFALLLSTLTPASASAFQLMPPWGSGDSRGEDLSISLVTFEPGDDVPSWFGHTALVVEDARHNTSRLYNYGMFSFDKAMLIKFVMGRLWFWVGDAHVRRTYEHYKRFDRAVRIQELNISPEKRVEVAKFLATNVLPDNREYLYHHYDDNCATRIRDVIDLAVDGQFKQAGTEPARMTLRGHTRRHSGRSAFVDALLIFWMNNEIDQPVTRWEEMFLPGELEDAIDNFEYTDASGKLTPLVVNRSAYYTSERAPVPDHPPLHWPYAIALGLLTAAIAVALARWRARNPKARTPRILFGLQNAFLGLLLGLPGLALAGMSLFTEHTVTYWNQNIFLANPLTFLAFPLGLAYAIGYARAQRWLPYIWLTLAATSLIALLLYAAGLAIPALHQDTSITLSFILPVNIGLAAAFWWKKTA